MRFTVYGIFLIAVCAENNADFFGQGYLLIPEAKTPDF